MMPILPADCLTCTPPLHNFTHPPNPKLDKRLRKWINWHIMLYFLNCVVEQITKQDIILGVSTVLVYEYGVSSFSERPASTWETKKSPTVNRELTKGWAMLQWVCPSFTYSLWHHHKLVFNCIEHFQPACSNRIIFLFKKTQTVLEISEYSVR